MSGGVREVLSAFLKLGLTSFGGPLAHLGYFRREFVERRRWVDETVFAQLLALSQFLPGPASSQLGFSLGLLRAGWLGAFAAFAAFTVPSAILLFAFAGLRSQLPAALGSAISHGLGLVAVAVVAYGVFGMVRRLCTGVPRAAIAVAVAAIVLITGSTWAQLVAVLLGAGIGAVVCRDAEMARCNALHVAYGPRLGATLLTLFATLLLILPVIAHERDNLWSVVDAFYRAGALVFGGGHVVLPLLEQSVVRPGWISHDDFLAGYGAAQAVPGPMFTLAAYIGARVPQSMGGGTAGAVCALLAIFLPGLLLIAGVLPLWQRLTTHPVAARAVAGVNAAVVGILAAALYNPVLVNAVHAPLDVLIAVVALFLLRGGAYFTLLAVAWCVGASLASAAWLS